MNKFKKLYLPLSLMCLLFVGHSLAATAATSNSEVNPQGMQLAHDTGYPHYHGNLPGVNQGSGRIRSYEYCSKNVFEPCRNNGGSYRYCNRLHHLCTYGNLRNCIQGTTC